MYNITFKNENAIKRIFKQPFVWAVLTVSNKNGYQKIALKKNLFNKTYTVRFTKNGQINSEKVEVSIEDIANQNIGIKGIGNYHIEDINVSLTNPSKTIQKDNEIYSKIDSKARKEEQDIKEKEIRKLEEQHEQEKQKINKQHEQEKQQTEISQKNKRIDTIIGLKEKLIKIKEHRHYKHKVYHYGYLKREYLYSREEDENNVFEYGIDFIIEKIIEITKDYRILYKFWKTRKSDDNAYNFNIYDDIKINMLMDRINKICKILQKKENYDENLLIIIQGLYGLLAEELKSGTYRLCEFIRENNIDLTKLTYEKYKQDEYWGYNLSKYTTETCEDVIDDYFNSLIEGIALFVERTTGEDIRKELQITLQKQYLTVIR